MEKTLCSFPHQEERYCQRSLFPGRLIYMAFVSSSHLPANCFTPNPLHIFIFHWRSYLRGWLGPLGAVLLRFPGYLSCIHKAYMLIDFFFFFPAVDRVLQGLPAFSLPYTDQEFWWLRVIRKCPLAWEMVQPSWGWCGPWLQQSLHTCLCGLPVLLAPWAPYILPSLGHSFIVSLKDSHK